jgi:hypothetical protein
MKNQVRALIGALTLLAWPAMAGAQSLSFNSGQNVSPAYEGWEEAADGSKYFLFGYMNRNWEEELNVPAGPANGFSGPAGIAADLGQPTRFLPRRNRFVFRVKVPATFTPKDEMIWTLTTNGVTEKAFASLREDYKVDDVVKASETGALGAGSSSPEVRSNKEPVVKIDGEKTRTVKVGDTIELAAIVTDDGIPKRRSFGGGGSAVSRSAGRGAAAAPAATPGAATPGAGAPAAGAPAAATPAAAAPGAAAPGAPAAAPDAAQAAIAQRIRGAAMAPPTRITVGKNVGLHLSWFVYRGNGNVMFEPAQIKPWEDTRAGANSPWAPIWVPPAMPADGRIPVKVSFSEPGTYIVRALADDGALTGGDNVTVTVTK